MWNDKNKNIKGYFAFVLMLFTVLGGSSAERLLGSIKTVNDFDIQTININRFIALSSNTSKSIVLNKLKLINSNLRSNDFRFFRDISINTADVINLAFCLLVVFILLHLSYLNNWIIKNKVWLRALF